MNNNDFSMCFPFGHYPDGACMIGGHANMFGNPGRSTMLFASSYHWYIIG